MSVRLTWSMSIKFWATSVARSNACVSWPMPKSGHGGLSVADVEALALIWAANAVLAIFGVGYYGLQMRPAYRLVHNPGVRADEGTLRVARRRIFRYISRLGLKLLFTCFCLTRAWIVWHISPTPILPQQWADALFVTGMLVWLTVDTIIARHYD